MLSFAGQSCSLCVASLLVIASALPGQTVLVEAESFNQHGGWKLDTQFVDTMGSPYLLAHGLGQPVADATTTVTLPAAGRYRVYVRTMDWVARWNAPGQPGRFAVSVDGRRLAAVFGTSGADWAWQDGGSIEIAQREVRLALHDATGFDGRCDAIALVGGDDAPPPQDADALADWRRRVSGAPAEPNAAGSFDLVVVGGGYAGIASAVSAARLGCRVALIQERAVLGGNGSSEVRVWSRGGTRRGPYPRLGEIVEEFADQATSSPGTFAEFGDARKEALVRAEPNLALFLQHRADAVELAGSRIVAVHAFDVRSGARSRFAGRLFADCTGHGSLGALAGAEQTVREQEHLGMSNMWRWDRAAEPRPFPETPWALDLQMQDFPYPRRNHGEWFWESGFDRHPLDDLEAVRDWNLRAVFGAFNAMKNRGGRDEHRDAYLTWVAYIGGTRESRQLLGDVVLSREDIVDKRAFVDGCVPTTWDIDLHYPKEQYLGRYADNPFISKAVFDKSVDREHGYPVPYRCFYSRNVDNLFMAGRCISVEHEALGTVRVMKTGGMTGEVVGKAASICVAYECAPRAVYSEHLAELQRLMRLPGTARRPTVHDPIEVTAAASPAAGIVAADLDGLVLDNDRAELTGAWTPSTYHPGFVGSDYLHDGGAGDGSASAAFTLRLREAGTYRISVSFRHGGNRAARVPVTIRTRAATRTEHVDQRRAPSGADGFEPIGTVNVASGEPVRVTISNEGTDGHVIVDAVRAVRVQ